MYFTQLDCERVVTQRTSWYIQNMPFKSPIDNGQQPVLITAYQGNIPSYQAGPREKPKRYPKAPVVAIKVSHGEYVRLDGWVALNFTILIWDNDNQRLGYRDVLNVQNRIIFGLQNDVIIKGNDGTGSFPLLDHPIQFELVEDPAKDFHPWYMGVIQVRFGLMSYGPGIIPGLEAQPFNITDETITEEIIYNQGISTTEDPEIGS